MNDVQNELPEFGVKVLDDSELMLVTGGVARTSDCGSTHEDPVLDPDGP